MLPIYQNWGKYCQSKQQISCQLLPPHQGKGIFDNLNIELESCISSKLEFFLLLPPLQLHLVYVVNIPLIIWLNFYNRVPSVSWVQANCPYSAKPTCSPDKFCMCLNTIKYRTLKTRLYRKILIRSNSYNWLKLIRERHIPLHLQSSSLHNFRIFAVAFQTVVLWLDGQVHTAPIVGYQIKISAWDLYKEWWYIIIW